MMNGKHKIVVLGGNSFSGQGFVDLLLEDPLLEVIGVSRSVERSELFLRYKLREDLSRYRYYAIDLNRDMPGMLELLDRERRATERRIADWGSTSAYGERVYQ